ncbi:MAG: hypothetical protein PHO28_04080 [Candidatus Pacebacteria bacterium]|nr:hypothetical protein [Candidatus Paceibacterota bacterium]
MINKKIKGFYEKYHTAGIENPVANFMEDVKYKMLKDIIKNENGNILIVGCGSWLANLLAGIKENLAGANVSFHRHCFNPFWFPLNFSCLSSRYV